MKLTRVLRSAPFIVLLASVLFVLASAATEALAEKRLALVVGNNSYPNLSAERQLTNAVNDARLMRETLEFLGFEVLYGEDLDRRSLIDKLFELSARLGPDDTAFFFFAGHGVSFTGANYLLPSDIPAPRGTGRAEEGRLADQALSEATIIERMTGSGARVAILVLDACRDNPLQASDRRSVGAGRGLAPLAASRGVFSIYSAGIGQAALDRLSPEDRNPNSLFTRVFVEKLRTPGLDLRTIATQTRSTVVNLAGRVGHDQVPAYYDQIVGDDVVLAAKGDPRIDSAPRIPAPRQDERRIALLIANGAYTHLPSLKNPGNDVTAIAEALRKAGFTSVRVEKDLSEAQMRATLADFGKEAEQADWALAYFAGQGFLREAKTYLVGVDAPAFTAHVDLRQLANLTDEMIGAVRRARRARLVVLDVCQDDPFQSAVANPPAHPVPSDTIALVSASPGQVALDGEEGLSPFASALSQRLATSGLDLAQLFRLVRDDVLAATKQQQEPRVYGALLETDLVLNRRP